MRTFPATDDPVSGTRWTGLRWPLWYGIELCGGMMIRSELVQKIQAAHPDLAPREIESIVSTFFDAMVDQLAKGGRVELRGFGAFSTRARDARTGRNPRTGDVVDVDAKRVPYFKPGKEMRAKLNVA